MKPLKISSSASTRVTGSCDIGKSKSWETLKNLFDFEEDNRRSISMNEDSSYASSEFPKECPGLSKVGFESMFANQLYEKLSIDRVWYVSMLLTYICTDEKRVRVSKVQK